MEKSQRRTPTPPAWLRGGRKGSNTAAAKHSGIAKNEEIRNTSAEQEQKRQEMGGDGGFRRISALTPCNTEAPKRLHTPSRSSARTPSPNRLPWRSPSPSAPARKSPARTGRVLASTKPQEATTGVAVAKPRSVYLIRTTKASPLLDEEYHRYRVAYNTLVQWRFANARSEASMATVVRTAQKKLLKVWIHNREIRNSTTEKRTQLQKLKHDLKLYEILNSEMELLDEWSRIERRNVLGVDRVARKLSAASVCLPLDDAKGDVKFVRDAMVKAMEEVESIKAMTVDMHFQVDNTYNLLRKLFLTLLQQIHFFHELETKVNVGASS